MVYFFWTYFQPAFGVLAILKINEKNLNSCEGKKKEKAEMFIYFTMAKAFLETFSESEQFVIIVLLLGEKMLEENGIRV